jgi:hypothetical protein
VFFSFFLPVFLSCETAKRGMNPEQNVMEWSFGVVNGTCEWNKRWKLRKHGVRQRPMQNAQGFWHIFLVGEPVEPKKYDKTAALL